MNPRKPTKLKLIQGTFRKDRAVENEPQPNPVIEVPRPPSYLNKYVKKMWRALAGELVHKGILTMMDLPALEMLTERMVNQIGAMSAYNRTIDEHAIKIAALKYQYDEWAAKAEETISKVADFTSMGVNAIDNVVSQSFMNRRIELDNWYEAERDRIYATIEDEEERDRALEELDHEADQRRRKLARDEAIASKNIAIVNAIMNTAQALTKALSQGGFIFGPAFAAIMAALGAVQIALIKKQPLPALAEGGLVPGGYGGGDRVLAMLEPGEMVIRKEAVRDNRSTLESINESGGMKHIISAPLYIQIDTRPIYEGMLKATENGIALIHKSAIRNYS